MSKLFWAILAVIVIGLIGVFVIANSNNQTNTEQISNPKEITASDHVEGPADAKVTLVEYGDFQCPACAVTYQIVKQLRNEYKDKVRFVFRHFPLSNIHPNAMAASRAAEAAGKQSKFFEMHDLLYENQKDWSSDTSATDQFKQYAKDLGLNVDQFVKDTNSSEVTDAINRDIAIGKELNVSATPTLYLNDVKLEKSPRSFEEFKAKIDEALKAN